MRNISVILFLFTIVLFCSRCNQQQKPSNNSKQKVTPLPPKIRTKPTGISYHFEKSKALKAKGLSEKQMEILLSVNRTDSANLFGMDSVLMPADLTGDREFYLPFPVTVPYLKDVKKIILFSYPAEAFAAYEAGELAYAGQTNMGRKADPTPTGLFFTNWKAEETTSTFNDEWNLRWNFNIENKLGVGFHQYSMPGYPASHSCLRLAEKDARFLYSWAHQWVLDKDENVLAQGTPVVVFGNYDFKSAKPWLQLVNDPHLLDISIATVEQQTSPFLQKIIAQQNRRDSVAKDE